MEKFTGICNINGVRDINYYFNNITNSFCKDSCIFTNYSTKDVFELNIEGNLYSIIFLGNIYNLQKLKNNSEFECSTSLAEEFVLRSYINNRLSNLYEFNGCFSFAIWNDSKKELFMARDHMGIKPLYYSIFDKTLYVSSSIDSLLDFNDIEAVIDSRKY